MDKETQKYIDEETKDMTREIVKNIEDLGKTMAIRFDHMKQVVGDYLELSSNLSIATIKANLKSV
ncbi:hypothetical protein ES708_17901 [subsurface metagenome]